MKLLLDENLSPRLCPLVASLFPGVAHVRDFNLQHADDQTIWIFAKEHGYMIVSKDEDFHQRSFIYGHPPKVVWLRAGNRSTRQIADILKNHARYLIEFETDPEASFLVVS